MARPKRNAFALLGWIVWKLLALVGLPMAKRKLEESNRNRSLTRRRGRR
ncbi:hypothetical protein [Aeromicrobium sp. 50.2.37]|nr:hypothetical protein [Aeromicrobium sp. 50.2.37]MCR4512141.1 hypothetical protein [Aeromicrobium sp. 50.2.37]